MMRDRLTEPEDRRQSFDDHEERNRRVMIGFFLVSSIALLVVSTMPPVLIAPALSQVLTFAALGAAIVAVFRRERPFADHLTCWDQAAGLFALSLFAGFFVDPAAVTGFLEGLAEQSLQASPPAEAGAATEGAPGR